VRLRRGGEIWCAEMRRFPSFPTAKALETLSSVSSWRLLGYESR
jgi:hypothetical protein